MSTPLNPLIVARLRKYWMYPEPEKLDDLFCELEGWIHLLGPGPAMPICDNCRNELSFDWKLCRNCYTGNVLCNVCFECYDCTRYKMFGDAYDSEGCCECGTSCGAYICHDCKILGDY